MFGAIRMRWTLAGAAAALALGLLHAPGASAVARDGGDPGFAVSAVGFESYFTYQLEAGESARGTLRLASRSERPQRIVLRAADVTTAENGGLEYGSTDPQLVGRWISIRREVRLDPGAVVEVPFRLDVDQAATAGDHLAGIVAINRRDLRSKGSPEAAGFSLRYLPRLAMTVQITVPGSAERALTSGGLTVEIAPSGTAIALLLRNTGQRLLRRTTGELVLRQGQRVLLRRRVDLGAFVPQTTLRYRLPLTGRPAETTYQVQGELRPAGAPPVQVDEELRFEESDSEELRAETGREARASSIPAWLVVTLAAAAALLLALGFALLSARRRLARREP